jgi:hypothetical protein
MVLPPSNDLGVGKCVTERHCSCDSGKCSDDDIPARQRRHVMANARVERRREARSAEPRPSRTQG